MKRTGRVGVACAMLGVALGFVAGTASAQQCAGFSDVAESDDFCKSVQWLRNRGITLGCGDGSTYCPNEVVSRAAMALFLNRMGIAAAPRFYSRQGTTGGSVIASQPGDSGPLCGTSPSNMPAVDYPQRMRVRGTVAASFSSDDPTIKVGMTFHASLSKVSLGDPFPIATHELLVTGTNADPPKLLHWSSDVIDVPPGNSIHVNIRLYNRGDAMLYIQPNGLCAIELEVVSANPASAPF